MDNIVYGRRSVSQIAQFRRCISQKYIFGGIWGWKLREQMKSDEKNTIKTIQQNKG